MFAVDVSSVERFIFSDEDLVNENSIYLEKKFNLETFDIAPTFLDMISKTKMGMVPDLNNPPKDDLNFYLVWAKKFAASSIIHYELIHNKTISFFYDDKFLIFKDLFGPTFHFEEAKKEKSLALSLGELQIEHYRNLMSH